MKSNKTDSLVKFLEHNTLLGDDVGASNELR
jgi:hypothetical protein